MPIALLQGIPGGPELVVIILLLFYLGVPVLLVVVVYKFLDSKRGYQQRIADLERRVEELEDEQP